MTATELYEIVKDHRDVWGKALAFCDHNDASYWASRVIRGDYSIQCSDSTSEAALLGLGVKWLVDNTRTDVGMELSMAMVSQVQLVKAIYRAIVEVKRAQAAQG